MWKQLAFPAAAGVESRHAGKASARETFLAA
jgi:hypothetical protein